ncbi:hypothetical protein [Pinibacter soli]|uniref:Uncharacterized protein n=1 Tax=Pinibacter soli TaxID=3044211 RepID=A0ABT6R9C6_9BACT|nr:hypothetical protein [Pinibacter soli]MDI3319147.1 hypothetical protein [Pinibacter soli]
MHYYKKTNLPIYIAIKSAPYFAIQITLFDTVKEVATSKEKEICEVWVVGTESATRAEFLKAFQNYLNSN